MEPNPERYLYITPIATIATEAEMLQKTIHIMNARLNLAQKHESGELGSTTGKDFPQHT